MVNGTGVQLINGGAFFRVWAPTVDKVELFFPDRQQVVEMASTGEYWEVFVDGVAAGTRYFYRLNSSSDRGDPASRFQPDGVHGPSEIVNSGFQWTDHAWRGIALEDHVLYELHVGTYTPEGTFEALVPHMARLKELGITAVELMPVAQFPGSRNWGYDGVFPYAVQSNYGGLHGLKKFVDSAHGAGMAVILDVVYNHLGPEGNYFGEFAPYFTEKYETPWGMAVNLDGEYSDPVREFIVNNALFWLKECHIDGLRLDACHTLYDTSAMHILEELQSAVNRLSAETGRQLHLFAESDANDPRYIAPQDAGGFGLNAQWLDDYHHSIYTLLKGTYSRKYLADYNSTAHFAKAYQEGFVYAGEYCPTRKRQHGRSSCGIPGSKFVVFIQNHDQIGNKPRGRRLVCETTLEAVKLAAATVIFSPYLPMLFMGEEYGESSPFLYFTDHSDPELIKSMVEGRAKEFAEECCADELADPQDPQTFEKSRLKHDGDKPVGKMLFEFYRLLLNTRFTEPALRESRKQFIVVHNVTAQSVVIERRHSNARSCLLIFHFGHGDTTIKLPGPNLWDLAIDSNQISYVREQVAPHTDTALVKPESFQLYYKVAE